MMDLIQETVLAKCTKLKCVRVHNIVHSIAVFIQYPLFLFEKRVNKVFISEICDIETS